MTYQRISLATTDPVGEPGPLPFAVANWTAEQVADLSDLDPAYGFTDTGFWPVVDDIPEYDSATEAVTAGDLTKDAENKRFVREWTVEALPIPVPEGISDRQFFHALALFGMITETEALAAVKTGDPPAAMEAFLNTLPVEDQFGARMLLEGATAFRRSHPLTEAFAAGMNMSAEQTDNLWRMAAGL